MIRKNARTLWIFLLLMALCHGQGTALYAQDTDSLSTNYSFRWKRVALPGALVVAGSAAVAPTFLRDGSHWTTNQVMDLRGRRTKVDDYIQYLPVVGAVTLDFAGVKARHNLRDRVFITATSYATLALLTNVPKLCIDEKRPESTAMNSFPSGHTATAFMGAELVRIEYGGWSGAAAYLVATSVGVLRMYNGRHWLHDVVAGAGVGILSARVGEWSAPMWQRLFRKKKHKMTVVPVISPFDGGSYGASLVIN